MIHMSQIALNKLPAYLKLLRPFTLLAPLIVSSSVMIASLVIERLDDQGERREAADADVEFVSELNGCLPFARPCGLGVSGSFGFGWLDILFLRLNLPEFVASPSGFKALRRLFGIVTYRGQGQCPVLNLEEGSDNFADATSLR